MSFKKDFFEIRLESIGGLGANLAGKILGEVGATKLNLNTTNFSSYGSEKRGSPVKSFIRYAKENIPIRVTTPIKTPDLLGLFHMTLAKKQGVLGGILEECSIVVNTDYAPDTTRDILMLYAGNLYTIDALKIAIEEKSRINMVMVGAIARASNFIPLDSIIEVLKDTIGKKYPKSLESNIKAVKRGFDDVLLTVYKNDDKYKYEHFEEYLNKWGYDNAPIGGVNTIIGSTITNDLSASREGFIPVFIKEKCINCGLCDVTCPDICFQFIKEEKDGKRVMINKGIDYHHCKGCLRCVNICPTNALIKELEKNVDVASMHVRNKDLQVNQMLFEDVGASSFVSSESNQEDLTI